MKLVKTVLLFTIFIALIGYSREERNNSDRILKTRDKINIIHLDTFYYDPKIHLQAKSINQINEHVYNLYMDKELPQ